MTPMSTPMRSSGKIATGLLMTAVLISTFVIIPPYEGLGNSGRIVILHVPTAWVSVVAFTVSAWFSIAYLRRKRTSDDDKALAAAESGFLFTILATVTGMIFSQVVWGIYWNWDPRQTSIFVLLLIYAALFALRAAISDPDRRRTLSAVYSIFAFITMPFLIFVAPRIADNSLHPNCAFLAGSKCDGIDLGVGRIGLLGDHKVELLSLIREGNLAHATVRISEPGLRDQATLEPTYNLDEAHPQESPNFPGQRFSLKLQSVNTDLTGARLNIQAPGTGLLDNRTTMITFLLSNLAFTLLFVWMFLLRSALLGVQSMLEQRLGSTL